jgi:hypothetical protein
MNNYWAVGANWGGNEDVSPEFLEKGIWYDGYAANGDEKNKHFLNQIKIGDFLLMKSSATKGTNHDITFTRLKGIGKIISKENYYSFKIEWYDIKELPTDFNYISYRKTIEPMRDDNMLKFAQQYINKIDEMEKIQKTIELLQANKNLILTGAPGTGKTYLAKQIVLQMLSAESEENEIFKEHHDFVQFHPSYDYTDFVEGLRPIKREGDMGIGFELKNGSFKSFCKRAITKSKSIDFDERYAQLIADLSENEKQLKTPIQKKQFKVTINRNNSCVAIPLDGKTKLIITKEDIRNYIENDIIRWYRPYLVSICDYFKENYHLSIKQQDDKPYVFVIDEINRGEISKIFGELFFSIDPGYRGVKGKVKTQYANIQSSETRFANELNDGDFYVPENVYIIGTMNDIDRSVESFDFAMRRRFAWKEITAEESKKMLDDEKAWTSIGKNIVKPNEEIIIELKKRMDNLNKAIIDEYDFSNTEYKDKNIKTNLTSAYQIGASYFLKYALYKDNNFDCLWNNHLKSLLFEYLRGIPDAETKLNALKEAYNSNS